jgi:hypothetical protein
MHRGRPGLQLPAARRSKSFEFNEDELEELSYLTAQLTSRDNTKQPSAAGCMSSRRLQPNEMVPNSISCTKPNIDIDSLTDYTFNKFRVDASTKISPLHPNQQTTSSQQNEESQISPTRKFASVFRVKSFNIKEDSEIEEPIDSADEDIKYEEEKTLKNGRIKHRRISITEADIVEEVGGLKALSRIRKKEKEENSSPGSDSDSEHKTLNEKPKRDKRKKRDEADILSQFDKEHSKSDSHLTIALSTLTPRRKHSLGSPTGPTFKCLINSDDKTNEDDSNSEDDKDSINTPISPLEAARRRLQRETITYTIDSLTPRIPNRANIIET